MRDEPNVGLRCLTACSTDIILLCWLHEPPEANDSEAVFLFKSDNSSVRFLL